MSETSPAAAAAKLLQSCLTLCDPTDYSLSGSSVHRILQARILEWVAIPFSRASSWLRDLLCLLHWQAGSLPLAPCAAAAKLLQSCPALCDPMDYSPPGPTVPGLLQAGILEWVAIPFSRASSWPRDQTWVSYIASRFFTIWATKETQVQVCIVEFFSTNIFSVKYFSVLSNQNHTTYISLNTFF